MSTIESYINTDIQDKEKFDHWLNVSQTKMVKITTKIKTILSQYKKDMKFIEFKIVPITGEFFNEVHKKKIEDMQEPKYRLEKLKNHLSIIIMQTPDLR